MNKNLGTHHPATFIGLPLVTIITVVLNGAKHLEEAMQSVFSQTYPNIEYIMIDGGSTDGSLDIIMKYQQQIDHWVSEPDRGIYDAMNKGIRMAQGEVIGLLNADDLLYPDSISRVVKAFAANEITGFVYGPVHVINTSGEVEGSNNPLPPDQLYARMFHEMPFPHNGCFVARQVYEEIGLFDISLKLTADYDFILRLLTRGYMGVELNQPIACFRRGGRSDGVRVFAETRKVHQKHGVRWIKRNTLFLLSSLKVMLYCSLPNSWIVWLKRFRRNSRHTVYQKKQL